MLAGGLALVAAALVALPLARPLRRLTDGARRMEQGELDTRVDPAGGAEMEQLAQALNRLAATLQREDELRREATEDLAHELRTPLTGIVSRIEAAQDGVLADEAANLEAMHAEALRLRQLTEDLDRLAEAQQPALLTARAPVDLAAVAAARADARAAAFSEKAIVLTRELSPAAVAGDESRLGQVVDNLLSNALRYSDPGGRVTVRTYAEGAYTVLQVADAGIGLAGDELAHVFERFWRSDESRARSRGGAGIGLAIVHELVRAHDATSTSPRGPARGRRSRCDCRCRLRSSYGSSDWNTTDEPGRAVADTASAPTPLRPCPTHRPHLRLPLGRRALSATTRAPGMHGRPGAWRAPVGPRPASRADRSCPVGA